MSDKVLIGIIVGILILVIVLIAIVANSLSNDGTRYETKTPGMITTQEVEDIEKQYSKRIDEAQRINSKYISSTINEYYVNLDESGRKQVDDQIDRVLGWVNSKNTEEFYNNHLSAEYRKAKFPSKEELDKFINNYFPSTSNYTINAYVLQGDALFMPIVKEGDVTKQQIMDIKVVDYLGEEFKLYFDNVQDIIEVLNSYKADKFQININYGIEAQNYCSFLLKITNRDNKDEVIDFAGTMLTEKSGKGYNNLEILGESKVSVPKGETVLFELKFRKYKLYPDGINWNVLWGGKTYNYDMYLNFSALDDHD